ncbi:spermidine synthase [Myxococcus sp. Y35]|uniref:spermidine synthase n=1 Tax=Pseudomyxococcus flavus TaxID=3115648 RepID=UPI003CF0B971
MSRYAVAIFASAFLLFGVQPLVGRYSLPWYGGTPSVWTACMLFFQVVLLGGYAYSHGLASRLAPRAQARVHLGLLAVTVLLLGARALLSGSPVAPGPEWRPEGTAFAVPRLLAMLAATIGLPFFVLSTTGPLLQSWFARARPGRSPYPLYALSNAGSLLALLGYPFLVEPWVGRGAQAWGWSLGFVFFAGACAVCALEVMKQPAEAPAPATTATPVTATPVAGDTGPEASAATGAPPTVRSTLTWLALSTCASVLLLATTNQLSQDVAAGPFLWVLPLAVYLLTFILAFSRESLYSRTVYAVLLIAAGAGVGHAQTQGPQSSLALQLVAYSVALFAGSMVCHGELYRLRPPPRYLSAFYLWVSMGGALGALLVSVLAPAVFRAYWEYPLSLGACCVVALAGMAKQAGEDSTRTQRLQRVLRGAMLLLVAGHLTYTMAREQGRARFASRNFFGVVRVMEQSVGDPEHHRFSLLHGAITHGLQYVAPERKAVATTYYTPEAGLGLAIAEQRRLRQAVGLPPGLRVGVLGLGVGTSAALLEAEDTGRFYEIDPAVIALARGEGGYFSYLRDTPAKVELVEGDARISLERELEATGPQGFDVLALDTFSSDAVPVHLLTQEAVALYRAHLAPHGVLAMHISNVHLDLVPLTLAHARALGLHAALVVNETQGDALRSNWMVLSPDREFSWGPTFTQASARVRRLGLRDEPDFTWTDEKSSVLHVLRRGGPSASVKDVEPSSGPPGPASAQPAAE